jgi:hypothetical protein
MYWSRNAYFSRCKVSPSILRLHYAYRAVAFLPLLFIASKAAITATFSTKELGSLSTVQLVHGERDGRAILQLQAARVIFA